MAKLRKCLYSFLGVHSFLIGLFPFYIPVYLYANSSSLEQVCAFIAITGLSYSGCLYLWDRAHKWLPLKYLIVISFICELVLLSLFFLEKNLLFLVLAGFFNGVFNCNFWIIQRLLFLKTVNPKNSGKKFGNFQLFVFVVLKISIFIGGILLESSGFLALYLLSATCVVLASLYFVKENMNVCLDEQIVQAKPLSLRSIVSFSDRLNSKWVFAVDGAFLYLESYFWIISLFLIVHQNFWRLGLVVVVLTIFIGVVFILIKNKIDRLPVNNLYNGAVLLYFISWILRAKVSDDLPLITLIIILSIITFCTSIFRLAFNKRFFDIAKKTTSHEYIFIKSYWSQFFLLFFFGLPLLVSVSPDEIVQQLKMAYFGAAALSTVFFIYRTVEDVK